jgi:hypothetical protein
MKSPSIFLAFFVLAVPFLAFGQQNQRSLTPEQLAAQRHGDLDNFDNYQLRFEAAYEENDLQSMDDIRAELVKIMVREVTVVQKIFLDDPANEQKHQLFLNQHELFNDFTGQQTFTEKDLPENLKTAPFLTQLHSFREGMAKATQNGN